MKTIIISDDPAAHTGFGTVVKNLFGPMHRDHAHEIELLAIALYPMAADRPRVIPTIRADDKSGLGALEKIVERDGWPDVIFLLGDWWYWQHDLLSAQWRQENQCLSAIWYYAPFDGLQMTDIAKSCYQSPDVLIAMSPFGKDALAEYSGRPVAYLPHGYDDRHYRHHQRTPKQETVFGVVSRNGRRKNIPAIVQAYWDLPPEIDARLILHTGRNDYAGGNLDAWIQTMGKDRRPVEWTDSVGLVTEGRFACADGVPVSEMPSIYRRIDCLVSAGREGFGLPYLEGRACGCRLILPRYSGHFSMQYPDAITYPCPRTAPDAGARDVLDIVPDVRLITQAMVEAHGLTLSVGGPGEMHRPDLHWSRLSDELFRMLVGYENRNKRQAEVAIATRKRARSMRDGHAAIVMPGDFGDVLLCTAVAYSLRKRHRHVTFITREKHFQQLRECPWLDAVEEFNPHLHGDYGTMGEIFESYYTPYFATQVAANWVLGGNGRSLAETYAAACNCDLGEYWMPTADFQGLPDRYATIHAGSGTGRHAGRRYDRWPEVAAGITLPTVQIGCADDLPAGATIDLRGKTTVAEMAGTVAGAALHLGIDSFPMHASAIAGVRSVIIWGNTMPSATGPEPRGRHLMTAIEPERPCPRACHRFACRHGRNCMQAIDPLRIIEAAK